MLDQHGALVDMLFCAQLSGNIRRTWGGDIFEDPRKVSTPHIASLDALPLGCRV